MKHPWTLAGADIGFGGRLLRPSDLSTRAEIARSTEPTSVVAKRYGISDETVRKWRKRGEEACQESRSREEKRGIHYQINQLLGAGASLPQENRSAPVLNAQLLHSIKVADVPLASLLWRVGTGSRVPTRDAFNRDCALVPLFGCDSDVNSQLALATMLIENGCPVDRAYVDGSTGLIISARRNNFGAVNLLLDAGARAHLADMRGRTALMWAAGAGHTAVVKLLLDAQPNLNGRDRFGITVLLVAVWKSHAAVVRLLQDAEAQSWRDLTD